MKNSRKGFVVPLLILLLAVGGGAYFAWKKVSVHPATTPSQNSTSSTQATQNKIYNTYNDPSGVLSFSYLSSWTLIQPPQNNGYITIGARSSRGSSVSIALLNGVIFKEYVAFSEFTKAKITSRSTVSGYPTDIYLVASSTATQGASGRMFVVDLGKYQTDELYLVIRSGSFDEDSDIDSLVQSISVKLNAQEAAKLMAVLQSAVTDSVKKGLDARVKADLSNLRAVAEIYYDGNKNSYMNLCRSTDSSYVGIKNDLAKYHFTCKDSAQAYAVSASLATSGFYCVDSTGVVRASASLNTTTVCPK